jgi:dTDP-4-dehydrorhamnose reductase
MMMRVLVTGAAGQLGRVVVDRCSAAGGVVALTRQDLDVTDERAVLRAVEAQRPDAVINCAAYNRVDDAEDDPAAALETNAFAVLWLARAASRVGATFVHYSTDFVFDGTTDRPYTETDRPQPESSYGISKLLGEWFAADAGDCYVLRVESLFGGPRAKSSIDTILEGIREDRPVRVFSDRTVTPSYVEDVAAATLRLLELKPPAGLYHCVNSGVTTWLGVAEEAARLLKRPGARIVPVSVHDVPLRAARPRYAALSNAKLQAAGIAMPAWQDALARYVRKAEG